MLSKATTGHPGYCEECHPAKSGGSRGGQCILERKGAMEDVSPLEQVAVELGRDLSTSCQGFILFQHEDSAVVGWSKVW